MKLIARILSCVIAALIVITIIAIHLPNKTSIINIIFNTEFNISIGNSSVSEDNNDEYPDQFDWVVYDDIAQQKNPVRVKRYLEKIRYVSGHVSTIHDDYVVIENPANKNLRLMVCLSEDDLVQLDIMDIITIKCKSLSLSTDFGSTQYIHDGGRKSMSELVKITKPNDVS